MSVDFVRDLTTIGVPPDIAKRAADTIASRPNDEHPTDDGLEHIAPRRGFAIRDTDLEFAKGILAVVPGLIALLATSAAGGPLAAPVIAIVSGLLCGGATVYWTANRKGADLTPLQCAVLVAVKERSGGKGASERDIAAYLSVEKNEAIAEEDVKAVLAALNDVTLRNGSKAPLAHRDNVSGLWRTDC